MLGSDQTGSARGRLLDAFATRTGMAVWLAVLLTVLVLAGLFVERSAEQTVESRRIFDERQMRNGFMSMTDIQRLLLLAGEARNGAGFTPQMLRDFATATDFLYFRLDHFRNSNAAVQPFEAADQAISATEEVLAVAERATRGPVDVDAFWEELSAASDQARRALTVFLEEGGRMQNEVVREQARAVHEQRIVVLASLVGLTVVGVAALFFLRKEVLARRAREEAEDHIAFLAYFDQLTQLTQLPNRAQFHAHLARLLEDARKLTLILVDVDHFKIINDTYGHATGDALLCEVAHLLSALAEKTDGMAARLGGDEFAVLIPNDNLAILPETLDALLAEAAKGFVTQGESIQIGLSIGYAASSAMARDAASQVDRLFRAADFALYSSKSTGCGRYTQYDRILEKRYQERRTMVEELTLAVTEKRLDVFLQPKVHLPRGETYGFEALVRWRRGARVVPSEEFVNVAEESGLISEIDIHVLRAATRVVSDFNRRYGVNYSVSVNLSALHFTSHRIVDLVREAMEASEIGEGLLTLEITETLELRDWWVSQDVIGALRALGARISIDDFGTGYSSLGYLRSKVVDEVKIDRSIDAEIETSSEAQFLLDGILDIARNLSLDVVVEGVERPAQQEMLRKMGAHLAQGFLYGTPVAAETALKEALESAENLKQAVSA